MLCVLLAGETEARDSHPLLITHVYSWILDSSIDTALDLQEEEQLAQQPQLPEESSPHLDCTVLVCVSINGIKHSPKATFEEVRIFLAYRLQSITKSTQVRNSRQKLKTKATEEHFLSGFLPGLLSSLS